jgi:hypothetical protein
MAGSRRDRTQVRNSSCDNPALISNPISGVWKTRFFGIAYRQGDWREASCKSANNPLNLAMKFFSFIFLATWPPPPSPTSSRARHHTPLQKERSKPLFSMIRPRCAANFLRTSSQSSSELHACAAPALHAPSAPEIDACMQMITLPFLYVYTC